MATILEAKGLSKAYMSGNVQQSVLKNINMHMEAGEFVSVMGPSGSGKSTLLYHISGMDQASAGSVMLDGEELSMLTEKELAALRLNKIGFVFQQMHLLKSLNIFDNIVLPAYSAKKSDRPQINKRALELMEMMGIAHLASHDITQASGGQLQRAAICRALINQPEIVFGDEPTGALNSKTAEEIMEILADMNRAGTTILVVTHDIKVAARTERVLYMLDGSLVGEKQLGKFDKEKHDARSREELLSRWLLNMGF